MRALLVMNMQENLLNDYPKEELISSINGEIGRFDKDKVIYVKTVKQNNIIDKLIKKKESDTDFAKKLNVVNNDVVSIKRGKLFDSKEFIGSLKKNQIDEFEIVGIDTCSHIFKSVIGGLKNGFKIVVNKNLVGAKKKERADKLCKKMQSKGAKILN